ncbi:MAG: LamG-like jellyroll fold domain-containing protein [Bryobacteraceae bacterium]|nr:LamG-like jellyroll fold domain-containing protein [Bryobacteraceae bacterium]
MTLRIFIALILAVAVLVPGPILADTFPSGFTNEVVASGLSLPTALAFAPGNRIFISTRSGVVRLVVDGVLQSQPFIDLSSEVGARADRGMLGIVAHPDFPNQPYVYFLYTYDPPGVPADSIGSRVARLVRVTANAAQNYNTAAPSSQVILMGKNSTFANVGDPTSSDNLNVVSCQTPAGAFVEDCIPQDAETHSLGALMFGNDGMLYAGVGDTSSTSYTDLRAMRAQELDSMAGKLFRIDPSTGQGLSDNPFYNGNPNANRSKVFSYGLRNPFRFAQDPQSGTIYIGDVGWNDWEEINAGRGRNFGWPCYEGGNGTSVQQLAYASHPATTVRCQALYAQGAGAVEPARLAYTHDGVGAAVIVGAVYTGSTYPETYRNALFYGDFNTEIVKAAKLDAAGNIISVTSFGTIAALVNLTTGPNGDLYYIGYGDGSGTVYRIRYSGGGAPTARITATPLSGAAPLLVNFDGRGSTDPDNQTLTYSWDFGVSGATSTQPNPSFTYNTSGSYTARLTVTDSSGQTSSAQLTVQVGSPPTITMNTPAVGATFAVGDRIDFSGSASDAQDGSLSNSIRWTATLSHNDHQHIDVIVLPGAAASGSFIFPDHGQNTYIILCARVTDSSGLSAEVCRDVRARLVPYTFNTSPQGLQIVWDGVARTAPFSVNAMVNSQVDISAPTPQQTCIRFTSWSDGNTTPSRRLLIGANAATLTANFDSSQCGGSGGDLVGHWKFDEGGGTSAADSSGNNNTATLINAAWSQGRAGAAANFNGGSGLPHARINGSASLNSPSAQITVAAWAYKHTNRPSWSTVASRQLGTGRDNQWYLSFLDGRPAFGINTTITGDQNLAAPAIAPLQQWVHLAGTYDGVTLRLYANGVEVASRPKTGVLRVDNNPLLVAANQNDASPDLLFNGRVDELRLYQRALSGAEILAIYNSVAPPTNQAPTVSLTSPSNGATYNAPATVPLSASASDPDGSIARVEFYNGSTKIGEDTSAPYQFTWTNVAAGSYQLSARAFDNLGAGAASAVATITVAGTPPPPPVTTGLIGRWKFDEGVGPFAFDSSGLNNTGRLLFCNWAPGLAGTSMKFYGDSISHLRINSYSALNAINSTFTVAAWINRDFSQSGYIGVITRQRGSGTNNQFFLGLNNNRYSMRVTTANGEREALGPTAPLGQWVHLAATYDGGTIRVYVDGVLVATRAQSGSILNESKPLIIAGNQNNTITDNADLLFDGRVDDARIYNRAISASEVQAIFNARAQ